MNVENVGASIAMIVDETKLNSNVLLSVEPNEENVITYLKELKLKPKQHFQIYRTFLSHEIFCMWSEPLVLENLISLVSLRTSTENYIRNEKSF